MPPQIIPNKTPPLSDLYLVYNDNYFTKDQLRPKFRSINLKLTYWINS
jgi:hypothetical protein